MAMEPVCRCGRPMNDNDARHGVCFRCKIHSIQFDHSGLQDRLYGEDLTLKQSQDRIVEDARKRGIEPEPVGSRWV